ncbi:MAG: hypothetical protein QOH66_2321 [Actinomycetota bacterium]|jgi:hypothetical protein|nr:hypothetical protein [Actinomycetota bacterium]MEA2589394.1 hypothetical protein [Actinomycetota bacterium]
MDTGPTDAGDDLERLMSELRAKGWSPGKLEGLRDRWEDICHDPMRRGRGGKGIPENERPERGAGSNSGPAPVPRPDIAALLNKAATWKAQPGAEQN